MIPKFRVWDKEESCWTQYFAIEQGGLFYKFNTDGTYTLIENSRYEVSLSTGLKDKNGKEIYEGDIINVEPAIHPLDNPPYEVKFGRGGRNQWTGVSLWKWAIPDNTGGGYRWEQLAGYPGASDSSEVEVIGNRWENPELLEGNRHEA